MIGEQTHHAARKQRGGFWARFGDLLNFLDITKRPDRVGLGACFSTVVRYGQLPRALRQPLFNCWQQHCTLHNRVNGTLCTHGHDCVRCLAEAKAQWPAERVQAVETLANSGRNRRASPADRDARRAERASRRNQT